jgi:hypothetical protein
MIWGQFSKEIELFCTQFMADYWNFGKAIQIVNTNNSLFANNKGFTNSHVHKPLLFMVGTGRFELPTSTVSVCLSHFTVFFRIIWYYVL